jgi:hypothetical protein
VTAAKSESAALPVAEEERETRLGEYLVLPGWGPSVLLERRGQGRTRLRPRDAVTSARELLCLPGYWAHLHLDSKVHLELWGNIPEFCGFPDLLLESAVLLRQPSAKDVDLDVDFVRGRIHVVNGKGAPARIRLRYLREACDITLNDDDSELCAELCAWLPGASSAPRPLTLGLYSKGRVTVNDGRDEHILSDHCLLYRVIKEKGAWTKSDLPRLPAWWTQSPDAKQDRTADIMISLVDWDKYLSEPDDVVQTIYRGSETGPTKQGKNGKSDPTFRSLAAYFLGAFDLEGVPQLARLLEDRDHSEVRRAAAHALRAWLARDSRNRERLVPVLEARIDPRQKAAEALRLLYPLPDVSTPAARARSVSELLPLLDDGQVTVCDLAAWHLEELGRASGISNLPKYDATASPDERAKASREWKRLLTTH